jgi:hypothetical protein
MLSVQVRSGAQVLRVLSPAQFLGAQVMPSAMFVEDAIIRFNAVQAEVGAPERALLVRAPVLH